MLRLPLRPLLTLGHTGLVIRANISSASSASSSISQIFVDNPVDIKLVLDACYHADSVALDTEFVQFPALVPRLQLVQVWIDSDLVFLVSMMVENLLAFTGFHTPFIDRHTYTVGRD